MTGPGETPSTCHTRVNASVTLTPITPADAPLLDNLWQFYELESSAWSGEDIDAVGRFNTLSGFLDRLKGHEVHDCGYLIHHDGDVAGLLLIGHQQFPERTITELADLYVLPKFRGRGIATEVVRLTVLASRHPWLICVFRQDLQALRFWERAFARLPFTSVQELLPPEYPDLREFIVNDSHGNDARTPGLSDPSA